MPNPASGFCIENGGRLEIREVTGGQDGYCIFPDGNECNEWQYFRKCTNKEKNQCQQPCRQITTTPKILPTETPTPTVDVCSLDPQTGSHDPDGSVWYPAEGERNIIVWFPGGGNFEAEHKLRLHSDDVVGLVNGGGSYWAWPDQCGEVADSNFEQIDRPEVTIDELVAAGLAIIGYPTVTPTATPTSTPTETPTPTATPTDTNP